MDDDLYRRDNWETKRCRPFYNAVNSNAINTIVSWGLTEEDITINYMPLFHTGGINALSIPILMAGGKVVIGSTI